MKYNLTLALLFSFSILFSQERVDSLTDIIVRQLISEPFDYRDYHSQEKEISQYMALENLKKTASTTDLKILLNHKDKYIRACSYLALSTRENIDLFPFLTKNINDTNLIESRFSCTRSKQTLGEFYLRKADIYINTSIRNQIIDSLLIYECPDIKRGLENNYNRFYREAKKSNYVDSILWFGWENYNILELNGFEHFFNSNKRRAINNIKKYYKENSFCNSKNKYSLCFLGDDLLTEKIIDILLQIDSVKMKTTIINYLQLELRYEFSLFEKILVKKLSEINEENINHNLLNILREVEDPYIYTFVIDLYRNQMNSKFKKRIRTDIKNILKKELWEEDYMIELKKRYKIIGL